MNTLTQFAVNQTTTTETMTQAAATRIANVVESATNIYVCWSEVSVEGVYTFGVHVAGENYVGTIENGTVVLDDVGYQLTSDVSEDVALIHARNEAYRLADA